VCYARAGSADDILTLATSPARSASSADSAPNLAFPAHTDGTWFTVIPCAAQPGLEVRVASGWVGLETHARHGVDVAVLSGEFLQSFTQWDYPAASHRVLRSRVGDPARFSAPMLMRASASYRQSCKQAAAKKRHATTGSTGLKIPKIDESGRPEGNFLFRPEGSDVN
jgi:isopenicillin N synthase-like dioxygenase